MAGLGSLLFSKIAYTRSIAQAPDTLYNPSWIIDGSYNVSGAFKNAETVLRKSRRIPLGRSQYPRPLQPLPGHHQPSAHASRLPSWRSTAPLASPVVTHIILGKGQPSRLLPCQCVTAALHVLHC